VSPILAKREKTLVLSAMVFADSNPPFTPKVKIPLCPFGKYFFEREKYSLDSKPG